jgi:putative flippase GtrA
MKQSLVSRLFWFCVGGGISVALNLGPFHWLRTYGGLSDGAALAISLTCVTVIFSIWTYFINFRTKRGWRECQERYLAAVAFCYLLPALGGLPFAGDFLQRSRDQIRTTAAAR